MKWSCVAVLVLMPSFAFADQDPLNGIRDLLVAGCHDEARTQLVQSIHTFQNRSDRAGEAVAWLLLGTVDFRTGDIDSARAEFDEAELHCAGDDVFTALLALTSRAELERQQSRYDSAIAAHERAVALLDHAAAPESRFSIASIKVLGPIFGATPEMLGPLAQYPDFLKPFLLRFMSALEHDAYGAALVEADQLDKAERQFKEAMDDSAIFPGFLDGQIAFHLGDLRERQWRLEEARDEFEKALKGAPVFQMMSFGDPMRELTILNKLAELELLTGRVDEGLAWNDRALAVVRETNQTKREADVLEARADLLQKAGRYPEAEAIDQRVLKIAKENADLWMEASVESDLGTLHMFQGTYGTAAKHIERAIELYRQLNEPLLESTAWMVLVVIDVQLNLQDGATDAIEHARALANKSGYAFASASVEMMAAATRYANNHGTLSDFDEALSSLRQLPDTKDPLWQQAISMMASTTHEQPGDTASLIRVPLLQAMPLFWKGKMLFDRGDSDGARAAWKQALDTNPNADIRAGLLGMIGASYWQAGKTEEAIRYVTEAAGVLETGVADVKVEEMLAGYLGGFRRLYFDLLIGMFVQQDRWKEAFAQTERARARAFLQMVGNHRFNTDRGADPRLLREAETLRNEIGARERQPGKSSAADLARARERYTTLLTRVKASNPEYASLTTVEPLRLDDVQSDLAPDTTLISYFISLNAIDAWVVDRNDAHHARLPLDRQAQRRIVCWAQSFGAPVSRGAHPSGECDDAATGDDAYAMLFKPLRAWITHPRLIIVPHGVLHYVPFAALHDHASGHYLIDDYTITYAPSASALRFLRAKESPVDGVALVLGDPATSLPHLPGAAQEATTVARLLGTMPHLGADAREALLYDLHGKIDVVHLAAHGLYDPASPLFSRIALAAGGNQDGNLTVQDILSNVDLSGVNLVVLSACQTAIGARSGGDEIVGLTRALLYAGTPGVVSTLWNISDAASAGLMEEFYRRLTGGASVAEALRHAQLAVKQRYSDPKYWAAFTLAGDPQGRWKAAGH